MVYQTLEAHSPPRCIQSALIAEANRHVQEAIQSEKPKLGQYKTYSPAMRAYRRERMTVPFTAFRRPPHGISVVTVPQISGDCSANLGLTLALTLTNSV